MKAILLYSVLMAVAVNSAIVFAQALKEDYARYTIESACAMKQVQYDVKRKNVDFSKCKEITWEVKI